MKTQPSKKAVWIKSLILMPLIAVLIYSFSEEKIIELKAQNKTVELSLEDINKSKTNYISPQEVPDIEININRNKEILINGENYATIKTLKKVIGHIIKDYTPNQISKVKTIIEADGTLKMGFIIDVEQELRKAGLRWRKLTYYGDDLINGGLQKNITRNQVIEYSKFWDLSTPEFHYTQQTYWIKDKNGKKIPKNYFELSEVNKRKWLIFPSNSYKKKQISKAEFEKIKDASTYVVRINGVAIENSKLNDYNSTNFVTYSFNQISELAGLPQKYHYNLITEEGFKTSIASKKILDKLNKEHQDKATPKELEEYNKLAKHYNSMSKNNMVVNTADVERLKIIYYKMTAEQKEKAEPFPNCPPPPPSSAKSIRLLNKKDYQAINPNSIHPLMISGSKGTLIIPMPYKLRVENGQHNFTKSETKYVVGYNTSFLIDTLTPPPPPPPPTMDQKTVHKGSKKLQKAFKDYSEESKLYGESVQKYRITKEGLSEVESRYKKIMELHSAYAKLATEEGVLPPPPPPPPIPPNPTDHMIEMAKKGALFYYEDKKISSDKAIEITKTNKSINIQVLSEGSSKPIVKLSKKPFTVEK